MKIRDRIREFKRIDPRLIDDNPKNWREHGDDQKELMQAVLDRIGIVDAVLVYEINGRYRFLDGHLRKELLDKEKEIPALIIDCTEKEADVILATFDEITKMGYTNKDKQAMLIDELRDEFDDIIRLMDIENEINDNLFESTKPRKIEIKPYNKIHVLLSFPPELYPQIQDKINKIIKLSGVEYEQSAN